MKNAKEIQFNISGMIMLNTPDGVLTGPMKLNTLGSTNWELRTIWDNPELRKKTTFYLDRVIVTIEDILKLP